MPPKVRGNKKVDEDDLILREAMKQRKEEEKKKAQKSSTSASEPEEKPKVENKTKKAKTKPVKQVESSESESSDQDFSDDEIQWEKPKSKNAKPSKGKTDGNDSSWKFKVFWIVTILGLFALTLLLRYGEDKYAVVGEQEEVNYYEVLEISKTASTKDIKKAYRSMALKWHPDTNPECGKPCEEKMALIAEAMVVLTNAETRSYHDMYSVKPPDHLIELAKAKHGGRGRRD